MSSDYDATEFVDGDFQAHKAPSSATSAGVGQSQRAPTREEVDSRVAEAQQKLAELKREQEELERQRAALEETRRRQMEFQTGRQETIQNLTRGVGLLEEAEFSARRDAEQMAKSLVDLRRPRQDRGHSRRVVDKGQFQRGADTRSNGAGKRAHGVEHRPVEIPGAVEPGPGRKRGHASRCCPVGIPPGFA